jgi:hypothetical protein
MAFGEKCHRVNAVFFQADGVFVAIKIFSYRHITRHMKIRV